VYVAPVGVEEAQLGRTLGPGQPLDQCDSAADAVGVGMIFPDDGGIGVEELHTVGRRHRSPRMSAPRAIALAPAAGGFFMMTTKVSAKEVVTRPAGFLDVSFYYDVSRYDDPVGGVTLNNNRNFDVLEILKNAMAFLRSVRT